MSTKTNLIDDVQPEKAEEMSLAVYDPELDVAEFQAGRLKFDTNPEFDPQDMFLTTLKLGQALTKEVQEGNAKSGQWVLTGEHGADSYTIVPMGYTKTRELRDPQNSDNKTNLLCSSDDGKWGVGEPGGQCSKCPLADWRTEEGGKKIPPTCKERFNYVVYVVEADCMARFNLGGMAVNAGRQLNTFIQSKGMGHFAVTVGSSQETNKKNAKYYVPTFALVSPNDAEMLRKAHDTFAGE